MEPLKYHALEKFDTIRVIRIRPVEKSGNPERIDCDIEHIQIGQVPYDALSYEWGLPNADDPTIHLNGSVIAIRRNLFQALSHLRYSLDDRPIWIDALSINQSDTLERNHQVRLMRSIYRGATQVMIWPGGTEDLDESAVAVVDRQSFKYEQSTEASAEMDSVYALIEKLSERTYWRRVWIQQEVFLAQYLCIMYGRRQLMSYDIFDHLLALSTSPKSPYARAPAAWFEKNAAHSLGLRKRASPTQNPLETWIRMACKKGLQTSEPRDLIYGMLGISGDCQDGGLKPDYDKPLPDVYLETMSFCRQRRPEREHDRLDKMLAEKLGLSWDSEMETRIQEYCQQKATVRHED